MEKYRITINGSTPLRGKYHYNAGEIAEVKIAYPTDVNLYVSSDDVDLGRPDCEDWYMIYRFEMPDHDVDITTRMENTMMKKEVNLQGINGSMILPIIKDNVQLSGFCCECGAPVKAGEQYCSVCGTKL